jgi:hypothetical protein
MLDQETQGVAENDPLFDLIGAAGDLEKATDVASNHHRYLALTDPGGQEGLDVLESPLKPR